MITGGELISTNKAKPLKSTEIIDTVDSSAYMASPMKFKRVSHGMGTITINGEDRLAVFGGCGERTNLDCVEIYNSQTEKWENTDIKLKEDKAYFGFLSVTTKCHSLFKELRLIFQNKVYLKSTSFDD